MAERGFIQVGIPHYGGIDSRFIPAVTQNTMAAVRAGFNVDTSYQRGTIIATQRNDLVDLAIKNNADYLMFIDTDMIIPPDGMMTLVNRNKDVVGGVYFARGENDHHPIVYKKDTMEKKGCTTSFEGWPITTMPVEPFQCAGIGTGFMLIKRRVLTHLTRPDIVKKWGRPFNYWQRSNGVQTGEDLSFCHRCLKSGFEIWADPTFPIGHIGEQIITRETYIQDLLKDFKYGNDIMGWMSGMELHRLYTQAKEMTTIIEIGSWKGRSTHALLSGCHGDVYAIDHFQGSPGEEQHEEARENPEAVYNIFMHHCGKFNNLHVIKADSTSSEAMSKAPRTVDMIFIDGAHTYEAVKRDLEIWAPKAKKLICGHDYQWEGVAKAVKEYFKKDPRVYDTIWEIRK